MVSKIKYEMVIILTNEFNNNELKTWIFNCAKALRKLGALEISVVSCNKKNFTYLLNLFRERYDAKTKINNMFKIATKAVKLK